MKVEALASTSVMEFALELSVDSVVLKGDSEFLMKALVEEGISLLSYGLLIADVKVLSRSFFFFSITFEGAKIWYDGPLLNWA